MSLFNSMNEFLTRMWFLPHVCQYEPLLHVGCSTLLYLSHSMEYHWCSWLKKNAGNSNQNLNSCNTKTLKFGSDQHLEVRAQVQLVITTLLLPQNICIFPCLFNSLPLKQMFSFQKVAIKKGEEISTQYVHSMNATYARRWERQKNDYWELLLLFLGEIFHF